MAATKEWMPRERWDALVRGEDCPLCATVSLTPGEYARRVQAIRHALASL